MPKTASNIHKSKKTIGLAIVCPGSRCKIFKVPL